MSSDNRTYEAELVENCISGDHDALARLIMEYSEPVYAGAGKALRHAGCRACVGPDDLVQEFFTEVVTWPDNLLAGYSSQRGPLSPWLTSVAFHRCCHYLRRQGVSWPTNTVVQHDSLSAVPHPPERRLSAADLVAALLEDLSDRSRDIVQAKYGVGSSTAPQPVPQIASRWNLSVRQLYRVLREALRKMGLRGPFLLRRRDEEK
jgi:RNA polymerase sigma factor (sigma-70 family)